MGINPKLYTEEELEVFGQVKKMFKHEEDAVDFFHSALNLARASELSNGVADL
ncbi:hypothetical protein HF072_07385 [Bacillus sp. RO3]|nr:hypothetical protein [Bacillus sp. RO3]